MPDPTKEKAESEGSASPASTSMTKQGSEPLESEHGQTSIADCVVTKVAGISAAEVGGRA